MNRNRHLVCVVPILPLFVWLLGCSKPAETSPLPVVAGPTEPDQSSPETLTRWFLTEHAKKEPDLKAIRKVLSKRLTKHFDEQEPAAFDRWVKEHAAKIEKLTDVGKGIEQGPGRMSVPAVIQAGGAERKFQVKVIKEGDLWFWEDL